MKERSVGEIFSKTYIAIPIREGPLYDWVQNINDHKNFYHMTVFYIGDVNNDKYSKLINTIKSLPNNVNDFQLIPNGLGFIGDRNDTFVLKIKNNKYLSDIRSVFEKSFPEAMPQFPFFPHITIEQAKRWGFSKKEIRGLLGISDISSIFPGHPINTIGLYYKTEEGATALLFSRKL